MEALDTRVLHKNVPRLSRSWEVRLSRGHHGCRVDEDVGPFLADVDGFGVTELARPGEDAQEPLIRLTEDPYHLQTRLLSHVDWFPP